MAQPSTNETDSLQDTGLACRACNGYGNFAPDPDCRPTSDCSRCDATGIRPCDFCLTTGTRAEVVVTSGDVACAQCAASMDCGCCGAAVGHAELAYRDGGTAMGVGFYCERCCEDFDASADRQAKRDAWECRGDYLREQQMERGL